MRIPFHASPGASLGIEVELSVIDRETRELTNAASVLFEELGTGHPEGVHPKAKHELFDCTVEIITGVCTTVSEARVDLEATLGEVRSVAQPRGLALISAATHPFSHWSSLRISPHPRYMELVERIQWPARRLAIHGVHFHVGVRSGEKAVAIANSLAFHLPAFLALSASSPFWHGLDTGMASSRTKIFEGLPTAGLPPQLDSYDDFEAFMETLIAANAIESVREVWWDVRPHPNFGTVELRMCDAMASLTEVAAVAALAQSLVHSLDARLDAGEPLVGARDWVIRENKWLAARYGLDGRHHRRQPRHPPARARRHRRAARRARADGVRTGLRERARRRRHHPRARPRLSAPASRDRSWWHAGRRGGSPHRGAGRGTADAMTAWLDTFLDGHRAELIAFRRHLHAHPELSYAERDTTDLIAQRLQVAGLRPRLLPNECGLICDIGSGAGPVLALRADIDALAMDDEKDVPYRSQRPGVAHACGHDVHATVVLGAGLALAEHAARTPGLRVRLLFEPAEESLPGGSVEVIDAGGLDHVNAIYGLHCDPKVDVGRVAVREGALTSATDMVMLELHGPGGHTARPHLTVDLVRVAAMVATELPDAVRAALGRHR